MSALQLYTDLTTLAAEGAERLVLAAHKAAPLRLNEDDRRLVEELARDVVAGLGFHGVACSEVCRSLHLRYTDEFGAEITLLTHIVGNVWKRLQEYEPRG